VKPHCLLAHSIVLMLAGLLFVGAGTAAFGAAGPKAISPSIGAWLEDASAGEKIAIWVFFRDKGDDAPRDMEARILRAASSYDPRVVERRLRARPDRPFDQSDLPLHRPYLEALKAEGVEFRTFSKWLNAVSILADCVQTKRIAGLPFVASLRRVSGRAGSPEPESLDAPTKEVGTLYLYGKSWRQLQQIQVLDLHNEGYTGTGVRVAIFDTGFWLAHETFSGLNLIAEHDFINNDSITANQPGDPAGQHDHGTMCLSLLAGQSPGKLMGAAFGAEYILAKTEDIADERPVEEDWWIAAAEWADSLGAQVISSSLCYSDWYTYADMDGQTAPITNAADRAALNGIVVVNAAGNSGAAPWRYIAAPADGDSVITLGSVDSLGVRSSFSSQGPTYDGRTKPTVMAMGQANYIADPSGASAYRRGSGTSFATPLAAGAIALLLEKHPGWLPGNVIEAITATGTRASNPDSLYGWGILQAYDASEYAPSGIASRDIRPSGLMVYPNPCLSSFSINLSATRGRGPLKIYDVSGRLLSELDLAPEGPTQVDLNAALPGVAPGIIFLEIPGSRGAKVLILR